MRFEHARFIATREGFEEHTDGRVRVLLWPPGPPWVGSLWFGYGRRTEEPDGALPLVATDPAELIQDQPFLALERAVVPLPDRLNVLPS